ncbi:MAG: cupin domain-containing protein [Henriciella sp.]|uniref:cupin domain-containing protein n=1 Tax=Henriciella sp. TaxID=1968823 RepID=UPI0032EB8A8F
MRSPDTYSAFMLDYAAGNLPPAMALAANIHRLMSSQGDEAALLWESVREVLLDARGESIQLCKPEEPVADALDIIHTDFSEVRWRRGLSGVKYAPTSARVGQMMRLEPGQNVYSHGHSALEATVVLEGALEDGHGVYKQGEILLADSGFKHRPAAHGNAACTCYVARSRTPFWRLT